MLPFVPPNPQIVGVVVVKVTASPEDAVALTVNEPLPRTLSGIVPKVMVCAASVGSVGI